VVLITGASSGIGLALAQRLALPAYAEHYHLVATTRPDSLHALEEAGLTPSDDLVIRSLDVTVSEERRAVVEEIERDFGGVDILINNAGISYRSVVEHMTEEDEWLQFKTNLFGPAHLMRLVLPGMRARREGRIINVSSVGGMMAMPTMGEYSASKFALEGLSEALYYEMKPWNVKVSLFQPGFVHSESFKKVLLSDAAQEAVDTGATYANYYRYMSRFIEKLMKQAAATPDSLARRIIKLMDHPNPPLRVPASTDALLFGLMTRFIPRRAYHSLLYRSLPGIKRWGTGIHEDD
jgi:NAD(P)-dependent dehydrogenase (short-subunit alcohol dehydrogenase family)